MKKIEDIQSRFEDIHAFIDFVDNYEGELVIRGIHDKNRTCVWYAENLYGKHVAVLVREKDKALS